MALCFVLFFLLKNRIYIYICLIVIKFRIMVKALEYINVLLSDISVGVKLVRP